MHEPIIEISNHTLDLQKALNAVKSDAHGAVDIFIGTVRNYNNQKSVSDITYDIHTPLAKKMLGEICLEAQKNWSETRYYVAHYKGNLKIGETSIVIAVSSPHRSESFAACRYVIENIKKRAPIWKEENYVDKTTEWLTGHKLQPNYKNKTIGIVLAGGKSSRMGENKAFIQYQNKPLVEHMISVLKGSGVDEVFISGSLDGYESLLDKEPYSGPAKAISSLMEKFPDVNGLLVVPIDMPLLNAKILKHLMSQGRSCFFENWQLPVYFKAPYDPFHDSKSVQALLNHLQAQSIQLTEEFFPAMKNINTKEDLLELNAIKT